MRQKSLHYTWLVFLLFLLILTIFHSKLAWAASNLGDCFPRIGADAAVLMDHRTAHILYSHNATQQRPPASTTKILTSLLGLELCPRQAIVSISQRAADTDGATLHLQPGECFYLYDLIKGALIQSGNDAAVAIAEYIGGKEELFLGLMDYKAKTAGACRSQFRNPHGLPHPEHYSTAYDLALLARYALRDENFQKVVSTKSDLIYELKTKSPIFLSNTNRLLWDVPQNMDVIGVKTGTTSAAGQCLVASAKSKGRTLISVVLHSSDRYNDTLQLLNYGFKNCQWFQFAKQGEPLLTLPVWQKAFSLVGVGAKEDLEIVVGSEQLPFLEKRFYLKSFFKPPLPVGTKVGCIEVYLKDHRLISTDLVTLTPIR